MLSSGELAVFWKLYDSLTEPIRKLCKNANCPGSSIKQFVCCSQCIFSLLEKQ